VLEKSFESVGSLERSDEELVTSKTEGEVGEVGSGAKTDVTVESV